LILFLSSFPPKKKRQIKDRLHKLHDNFETTATDTEVSSKKRKRPVKESQKKDKEENGTVPEYEKKKKSAKGTPSIQKDDEEMEV